MDKMRQEFEAWAVSEFDYDVSKSRNGSYHELKTFIAWESWQASRAVLCIELPDSKDDCQSSSYFEDGWLKGFNNCLSEVQDAFDQAGVSYE